MEARYLPYSPRNEKILNADIPCVRADLGQELALRLFGTCCQSVVIILRSDAEVGPPGPLGVVWRDGH